MDGDIEIKELYRQLFQRSMYQVGELWENNRITVANEHLATSITESLLNLSYPSVFATERIGKIALISCSANEFHQNRRQDGGRYPGTQWVGQPFLGSKHTRRMTWAQYIQDTKPDLVGLSLSILSNMDHLKRAIEVVKTDFPNLDLLIGGQAFRWGGIDAIKRYAGAEYIPSLEDLEKTIKVN